MSTFTLPQSGNVNVYYDSLPTGVAVPANTLHLYQLNNPGGGVDAYTKTQTDAKYVKYDNGGATQFINGPLNIATETITPQVHLDSPTKDTIITATPSTTDRTHTIPATDTNTQFIMANPTTEQTIQKKITTPQSIVTGTGIDIYGTTALTGRHTKIVQNLNDTANAAPTVSIIGVTDAGATTCEFILSHPSHPQTINGTLASNNIISGTVTVNGYVSNVTNGITMQPTNTFPNGVANIRFNHMNGVQIGSIYTTTNGELRMACQGIDATGYTSTSFNGTAITCRPANTSDCTPIKILNAAGTKIGALSQNADNTTIETTRFKLLNDASPITTFGTTITGATDSLPRDSAVKNYVDTQLATIVTESDIVTDFYGTLTNTQVPGALANITYMGKHLLPFTQVDLAHGNYILQLHDPTQNNYCVQKIAWKTDFYLYSNNNWTSYVYRINKADKVLLELDLDWITCTDTYVAPTLGRKRRVITKAAGTTSTNIYDDGNGYFYTNTTLPYCQFDQTIVTDTYTDIIVKTTCPSASGKISVELKIKILFF